MPHKRAKFSARMADRTAKGKDIPPSTENHFKSLPKGAMRILNAGKLQAEHHARKLAKKEEEKKGKNSKGKGKVGGRVDGGEKRTKGKQKEEKEGELDGKDLKVRPGEDLREFNRRVESAFNPAINSTIRSATESGAKKKRKRGEKAEQKDEDEEHMKAYEERRKKSGKIKGESAEPSRKQLKLEREALQGSKTERDFAKANQRRKINDVVLAPPRLTKAPRGEGQSAKQRKAELKALLAGKSKGDADSFMELGHARLPEPLKRGGLKKEMELEQERKKAVQAYRRKKEAELRQRENDRQPN